jgi:phosphatidylglycerol:prolipoprotein diacylglycerol transferase
MKPEIDLLGISVKTFGVMFALGFLACGCVLARRLRELHKPVDWSYELVFAALLGGVIGARGFYVIQNYSEVRLDLW